MATQKKKTAKKPAAKKSTAAKKPAPKTTKPKADKLYDVGDIIPVKEDTTKVVAGVDPYKSVLEVESEPVMSKFAVPTQIEKPLPKKNPDYQVTATCEQVKDLHHADREITLNVDIFGSIVFQTKFGTELWDYFKEGDKFEWIVTKK